jgi:hypothetical protein
MSPQSSHPSRKFNRAAAGLPPLPAGGDAPLRKRYRVCPGCPYFCRVEENITVCSRCAKPLLERCICGDAIDDPMMAICAACSDRLRGRLMLRGTASGITAALVGALGGR